MVAACQVGQCQLVVELFHISGLLPCANQGSVKVTPRGARAILSAPPSCMYRSNLVAPGGGSGLLVHDLPEDGGKCHAKSVVETPSARIVNFH